MVKQQLVDEIRRCVEDYNKIFLFSVQNMRNAKLKDLRAEWRHSRYVLQFPYIFFPSYSCCDCFRECHTSALGHVNEIDQLIKFVICCKIAINLIEQDPPSGCFLKVLAVVYYDYSWSSMMMLVRLLEH
jgi:Ribosomal protein L10